MPRSPEPVLGRRYQGELVQRRAGPRLTTWHGPRVGRQALDPRLSALIPRPRIPLVRYHGIQRAARAQRAPASVLVVVGTFALRKDDLSMTGFVRCDPPRSTRMSGELKLAQSLHGTG
jgi:hypothetical protein